MSDSSTSKPKTTALPWAVVALLYAIGFGMPMLVGQVWPNATAPAAAATIAALGTGLVTPRNGLWCPAVLTAAMLVTIVLGLPQPLLWAVGLTLAMASGWEVVRTGGRGTVFTVFLWIALLAVPSMPEPSVSVPAAALGYVATLALMFAVGLIGAAKMPPVPVQHGVGVAAFIMIGLILSVGLARHVASPFAHWIVLLFVVRAMAPPGQAATAALTFGLGALAGCLIALAVIALHLPTMVMVGLALMGFAIGLRTLPHPLPFTPAAMSAAILLLVAPDPESVFFRMEATAAVVLISVVVAGALGWLVARFEARSAA